MASLYEREVEIAPMRGLPRRNTSQKCTQVLETKGVLRYNMVGVFFGAAPAVQGVN